MAALPPRREADAEGESPGVFAIVRDELVTADCMGKRTLPAYAALLILVLSALGASQSEVKRSNPIVEAAFAAWNSQDPDNGFAAYSDDIV